MSIYTSNSGAKARIDLAQVSVANANRDGTGTVVDLVVAGSFGTTVTSVEITAIVTTTAGMIRFYLYDGANTRLLDEVIVTAITVGANVPAFHTTWGPQTPLVLLPTWKLRASTHNGETFNLTAKGADY